MGVPRKSVPANRRTIWVATCFRPRIWFGRAESMQTVGRWEASTRARGRQQGPESLPREARRNAPGRSGPPCPCGSRPHAPNAAMPASTSLTSRRWAHPARSTPGTSGRSATARRAGDPGRRPGEAATWGATRTSRRRDLRSVHCIPSRPAVPGGRSQSAAVMTSRLCSMTTTGATGRDEPVDDAEQAVDRFGTRTWCPVGHGCPPRRAVRGAEYRAYAPARAELRGDAHAHRSKPQPAGPRQPPLPPAPGWSAGHKHRPPAAAGDRC